MDISSLANSYYMNSLWSNISPYSSSLDSPDVPLVNSIDQAAQDTYEGNLLSGENADTQYQNLVSSMAQNLYNPSSAQVNSVLSPLGLSSNIDPLLESIDGTGNAINTGGDPLTQEILGNSDELNLLPYTSYLMNNPGMVDLGSSNSLSSIYTNTFNQVQQDSFASFLDSFA